MPPEVAARLQDTLARLVAERDAAGPPAVAGARVLPWRRRWAPRAAAAAAAVVVLGGAGAAAASLGLLGGSSPEAPGPAARGVEGPGTVQADQTPTGTPTGAPTAAGPGSSSLRSRALSGTGAGLPQVSAASFAGDVARLLQQRTALVTPEERPSPQARLESTPHQDTHAPTPSDNLGRAGCDGPPVHDGAEPNPVRYDGHPAVLLIHPLEAGRRLVEAWTCAGDRRLASASLAAPGTGTATEPGLASPSAGP